MKKRTHCKRCGVLLTEATGRPYKQRRGARSYACMHSLCRNCTNEQERAKYRREKEEDGYFEPAEEATRPGPPAKIRIGRPQYERWLREMVGEVRGVSGAI